MGFSQISKFINKININSVKSKKKILKKTKK